MPMIDVYAPNDLFPLNSDRRLGEQLTLAILRAEAVTSPAPFHLDNTAAFIHRMDPPAVQTAARADARAVRVQIITHRGTCAAGCAFPVMWATMSAFLDAALIPLPPRGSRSNAFPVGGITFPSVSV